MTITKSDLSDVDIVDAYELKSDGRSITGYSVYLTTSGVTTTASTKTVVSTTPTDGEGLLTSKDHPVQEGDYLFITGSSGGVADGKYTIATIVDDITVTVNETIADSTGGTLTWVYPSGASEVGFDPSGQTVTTSTTLQGAVTDVANNSISATDHETLRQLVHLADGVGGPMDGWPSGSYRETLPLGSPFPTTIIWWTDNTTTKKIVQKTITFNLSHLPTVIAWTVFASDGTTAIATVTDTITYTSTVFEQSRTRTVT